jgi:hypothetical protein
MEAALFDWFVAALRQHAKVSFFLAFSIGYLLGMLHLGSFCGGFRTPAVVMAPRSLGRRPEAARGGTRGTPPLQDWRTIYGGWAGAVGL